MFRWEGGRAARITSGAMDSIDDSEDACRLVVNSHFDSGNIEVCQQPNCSASRAERAVPSLYIAAHSLLPQIVDASDPGNVQLRIHEDPFCVTDGRAHFQ